MLSAYLREGHLARLARRLARPLRQVSSILVLEIDCGPHVPMAALEGLITAFCHGVWGAASLSAELDQIGERQGPLLDCLELDAVAAERLLPQLAAGIDRLGFGLVREDCRHPAASRVQLGTGRRAPYNLKDAQFGSWIG